MAIEDASRSAVFTPAESLFNADTAPHEDGNFAA